MKVYLDNAATTTIDSEVFEAMIPVLKDGYGNPSSSHFHGRKSKSIIERARKNIAKHLNCSPGEIIFTSGGTEADNMAIHCAVNNLGVKHIVTSRIEHHAVGYTVEKMKSEGLVDLTYVHIDEKGHIDLQHLDQILATRPKTLVSLMHANNEIGNLLPIERVSEICEKHGAIFHSDTVQTMSHYTFDMKVFDKIHFLACSAHKFHGPKGVGFLYINKSVKVKPFIYGGSQERNMRGGTENIYGIVGLSKAMDIAYSNLMEHKEYISSLKSYMIDGLNKSIDGIYYNGDSGNLARSLYTILSVSFPPTEISSMLLFNMDIMGVSCSGGSACTSGANISSHVLEGIEAPTDRPTIRFSFSRFTTKEEIDYTINCLVKLYS